MTKKATDEKVLTPSRVAQATDKFLEKLVAQDARLKAVHRQESQSTQKGESSTEETVKIYRHHLHK